MNDDVGVNPLRQIVHDDGDVEQSHLARSGFVPDVDCSIDAAQRPYEDIGQEARPHVYEDTALDDGSLHAIIQRHHWDWRHPQH